MSYRSAQSVGVGLRLRALEGKRGHAEAARTGVRLRSWRWPILISLVVVLAVEVPFRLAAAQIEAQFVGMIWSPHDAAQYLSAMRQGAANGSLLTANQLTSEPHRPALIYPLYSALGWLASWLGLGQEQTFLAASTLGRLFLALSVYAFAGVGIREAGPRRLALVLITLGSGLASVVGLLRSVTGLPLPLSARELNDPEMSTFLDFFAAPHSMVSLGLLLVATRLYAACWESRSGWLRVGLMGTVAALGFVSPFPLVPLGLIVGLHALVMTVWHRRLDLGGIGATIVVGAASAPWVIYSAFGMMQEPIWAATYGVQNQTLTAPPVDVLLAFGLLTPLALLGVRRFARPLTPGRLLVLVWIVAAVALMYAPTGIQRRFALGLHPMLGLVAAYGLWIVAGRISKLSGSVRLLRPLAWAALGQSLFGSTVFMLLMAVSLAQGSASDTAAHAPDAGSDRAPFQPVSLMRAGDWLAANNGPNDVILASTLTGNYLAGVAPARVYVGHWVATLDFTRKKGETERLFARPIDASALRPFTEQGVTFVIYGPHERLLAGLPWDSTEPLRVGDATLAEVAALDGGRLRIYQVRG